MLKYLLDTNIVIYVMKKRPPGVRETFVRHQEQLAMSSVSLMELVYGVEKSAQPARDRRDLDGFAARLEVLDYDAGAADQTGQVRAELAQEGRPIGSYDAMIAGHARAHGLIVVTNNRSEFERVPGLRVENWV